MIALSKYPPDGVHLDDPVGAYLNLNPTDGAAQVIVVGRLQDQPEAYAVEAAKRKGWNAFKVREVKLLENVNPARNVETFRKGFTSIIVEPA